MNLRWENHIKFNADLSTTIYLNTIKEDNLFSAIFNFVFFSNKIQEGLIQKTIYLSSLKNADRKIDKNCMNNSHSSCTVYFPISPIAQKGDGTIGALILSRSARFIGGGGGDGLYASF